MYYWNMKKPIKVKLRQTSKIIEYESKSKERLKKKLFGCPQIFSDSDFQILNLLF